MRLYLIATILLITIYALSEVSAKQKHQKLKITRGYPAEFLENKRRLKRQVETAEVNPNVAVEKDVPQTENKENQYPCVHEENKSNDSSNSESKESGEKKGKVQRSIVQNDVSDSKSDESKENKIRLPRLNKIRRSLYISEPDSSRSM